MTSEEIMSLMPYKKPFFFVDELTDISEAGICGNYTFQSDASFYKGHFINNPITPGAILTETMAQIGIVSLGIYLMRELEAEKYNLKIALTSTQIDFFLPVKPGEKVTVISEKEYFRFHKLKCKVKLLNERKELVCRGTISGMINLTKS